MEAGKNIIPKQVQQQADQDDVVIQQRMQTQQPVAAVDIPQPPIQPQAQPQTVLQPQPQVQVQPQAPTTPLTPEQELAALRRENQSLKSDVGVEKQKNSSLVGRINTQGPQQAARIRELERELIEKKTVPVAPVQPQKPAYATHLSEAELNSLDREQIEIQAKIARGESERTAQPLRQENSELSNRVNVLESARAKNDSDDFFKRVEVLSSGAVDINAADTVFHSWLDQIDPISGQSYRTIAGSATEAGDVQRVADLITVYKQQHGIEVSPEINRRIEIQQKPTNQRSVTPVTVEPEKRLIPESEIKGFYTDKAMGKLRVGEEEAAALEKEYGEAAVEGRVTL